MAPVIGLSAAPVLLRGMLSPPRTALRTPAERRPDPMLRAADHEPGQLTRTTRTQPPTPGSARRRATRHRETEHANRRPAAHRRNPAQRPDRSPTQDNEPPRRPPATQADASCSHDARRGWTIENATQTQNRGHSRRAPNPGTTSTGRPSGRAAEKRRPAREQRLPRNRETKPKTRIGTTQRTTTKTCVNDPTGTTHGPNAIQRPDFNDRHKHHDSGAVRTRRGAAGADIQRDIRPLRRQRESWTAATHDRTMRSS